jgi:hypothetical protein
MTQYGQTTNDPRVITPDGASRIYGVSAPGGNSQINSINVGRVNTKYLRADTIFTDNLVSAAPGGAGLPPVALALQGSPVSVATYNPGSGALTYSSFLSLFGQDLSPAASVTFANVTATAGATTVALEATGAVNLHQVFLYTVGTAAPVAPLSISPADTFVPLPSGLFSLLPVYTSNDFALLSSAGLILYTGQAGKKFSVEYTITVRHPGVLPDDMYLNFGIADPDVSLFPIYGNNTYAALHSIVAPNLTISTITAAITITGAPAQKFTPVILSMYNAGDIEILPPSRILVQEITGF